MNFWVAWNKKNKEDYVFFPCRWVWLPPLHPPGTVIISTLPVPVQQVEALPILASKAMGLLTQF
jgi:hypothetical protein